jgi:glutamyl-tRNA reductase
VLGEYAGITCEALLDSAFVHHGDAAVHHLFEVAAGLDSLVVGEEQILGQLRAAYAAATDMGAVGSVLHALVQRALRVGKQVRSETGLTRSGASIVSTALDAVTVALSTPGLDGKHAVVLGAGTMGALAVSHLQRSGVSDIAVINRTPSRARQLARGAGSAAVRAIPSQALVGAVVQADVLVACAATSGALLSRDWVESVVRQRAQVQASLVICDLGLPRNVEPEVASVPGVILVNIHTLQAQGAAAPCEQDVAIAGGGRDTNGFGSACPRRSSCGGRADPVGPPSAHDGRRHPRRGGPRHPAHHQQAVALPNHHGQAHRGCG